jgi:hypothetical protein
MLSTSAKSIRILLSGPPRGNPRISFTAACKDRESYIIRINIVDRHRHDYDPDQAFHFYANLDLNPDPIPGFTQVGKKIALLFTVTPVFFLVSVIRNIISVFWTVNLNF